MPLPPPTQTYQTNAYNKGIQKARAFTHNQQRNYHRNGIYIKVGYRFPDAYHSKPCCMQGPIPHQGNPTGQSGAPAHL